MSDIVSLDDHRQRKELERLLRASLGQCGQCGRQVIEHNAAQRLECWAGMEFDDNNKGA